MYRDIELPDADHMAAWNTLYGGGKDPVVCQKPLSILREDGPLAKHIRQTEHLCAELDHLRSSLVFANAELTELKAS